MTSNQLLVISFLISLSIATSVSRASEQVLAKISTDVSTETYQFIVDYNEETRSLNAFYIDTFSDGPKTNRDEMPMDSFLEEGLSLPKKGKHVFATINGENFDRVQGGAIVISTLYNIINGKRKSYELTLAQDQTGWKLFYHGKAIERIKAIANKLPLIGVVGAKDLAMN